MRRVLFWRRIDIAGLERLELDATSEGVTAQGTVLCTEEGGLRIDHTWRLDRQWRALSVSVERWTAQRRDTLLLERAGHGWRVNGAPRPDLDGAEEPDLSVTPFCNTLPIHRMGASLTLDTAYIDAAALTVARSRQRYERRGPRQVRYIDLGLSAGFEADLAVDEEGLVLRYEHLFERVG